MKPVVLVGLRFGQPERDRNWAFNRARWETLGWPIFEGHHDDGPFCMSIASNLAAAAADTVGWDVALYVGGDFALLDLGCATGAVATARASGQFTIAHASTEMLDEAVTGRVVAGTEQLRPGLGPTNANPFTGVVAFPRGLYEKVGGFDERFVGWGGEDQAFWAACWALAGDFQRCEDGVAFHLWHPTSRDEKEGSATYPENDELMRRYLAARTDREATLAILAERS